LPAETHK